MELQAQTVELLSILATKKFTTKEPRAIDRPDWVGGKGSPSPQRGRNNPFARAIDRMLALGPPKRAAA